MRGCQASTGSRADTVAKPLASCQHVRQGSSCRGLAQPWVVIGPAIPTLGHGLPRPAIQLAPHASSNTASLSVQRPCAVAGNDSSRGTLSLEEEEAYQQFLQKRKAERKAWKVEVRRRAKFDPMASPTATQPSVANPQHKLGGGTAPKPAAAALQALSRPKAPPQAAAPAAPPSRLPQPASSPASAAPTPSTAAAAAAAPASAKLVDLSAGRTAKQQQLASAAAAAAANDVDGDGFEDFADSDDEDGDENGALDVGGLAAMARKVLADDDEAAVAEAVPVAASGSGNPRSRPAPGRAAPAATRRPGAPAPKRQLMPIAQLQRQRAAATAAAAAAAAATAAATAAAAKAQKAAPAEAPAAAGQTAGGFAAASELEDTNKKDGDDNELDWDALQAYEKYEQYVNEVAEEEECAARAAARRAASAAATTSTAASSSPSDSPAKSAAGPAAAAPAAPAAGRQRRQQESRVTAAAIPSDPTDKLDRQLDQWEHLINFFEVVERDSRREQARKQRLQAKAAAEAAAAAKSRKGRKQASKKGGGPAAGAAAAAAVGGLSLAAGLEEFGLRGCGKEGLEDDDEEAQGEVEVDWQSLERLFLGEGWEAELEGLAAKVEASDKATRTDGEGAAAEDEEVESWRDEVSTLLLGLVEISAKRYLGSSLLEGRKPSTQEGGSAAPVAAAVGEEERAAAFWEAPFLLLVQDDSADPLLEYVNRAALTALRLESFDEATAGLSAVTLVDPAHPRSQQEWLWACTEAAERPERFATISSLRLRGPSPGSPAVLASDVTVFRVDSLEERPIGQAVLVRSWRQLRPEEQQQAAQA